MRGRIAWLAGAACTLSGCAGDIGGLRPLTYQEPAQTRLVTSYDDCPNLPQDRKNLAPVLAAIAMGVASKMLDNFGTALTKGSEGGKLPASIAMSNIELDAGETPKCLIVIRGHFEKRSASDTKTGWPAPAGAIAVDGRPVMPLRVKTATGGWEQVALPDVYGLQHYMELQIIGSRNQSALAFAPVLTRLSQSMDGQKSGSREISVALKFERPGKDAIGSAVLINDHPIGSDRRFAPRPDGHFETESPWFAAINPKPAGKAPDAADAGAAAGQAPAQGGQGVAAGQAPATPSAPSVAQGGGSAAASAGAPAVGPFPFTVTATVVETRPTREFLAFVASVFTAARPAIDSAIKSEIDPATRRTEANAGFDAEGAFADALGKAHAAVVQYCALPETDDKKADRFTKSGEARKAQITANKAGLAADSASPFEALIDVSGAAPKTANPAFCK